MRALSPLRAAVAELCDLGLPWQPRSAALIADVAVSRARAYARQLLQAQVLMVVDRPWWLDTGRRYQRWRAGTDMAAPVRSHRSSRYLAMRDELEEQWYRQRASLAEIGLAVREAREGAGLSLRALAAETGIPHSNLVRLEQGRRGHQRWPEWRPLIEEVLGAIPVED